MKNILVFTNTAFEMIETFIINQFRFQKKNNVIGLCHRKTQYIQEFDNDFFIVSSKPINLIDRVFSFVKRKFKKEKNYSFSFFTEKKIIKIIKNKKIDIIHCNYGTNACKFINIVKKTGIKLVVHFHGFDASKALNDKHYIEKLPLLYKLSHKIIVVSEDMKKTLTPFFKDTKLKKILIIPYGIDLKSISASKVEQKKEDSIIKVLHAGRITNKKGVPDLVKVFGNIINKVEKRLKLYIIGSGEEYEIVENIIKSQKLGNYVYLVGSKPHMEVVKYMKECDIFVLNSRIAENGDKEGYPNVIIEAMACELAIVSTYHAGIPMAITNEKEGLLVEEKNNRQLEDAIIRLIENTEERIRLSKNAKIKAFTQFSIQNTIEKYEETYV